MNGLSVCYFYKNSKMWDKQMLSRKSEMLMKEQKKHKAQQIQKSGSTIMFFF